VKLRQNFLLPNGGTPHGQEFRLGDFCFKHQRMPRVDPIDGLKDWLHRWNLSHLRLGGLGACTNQTQQKATA
jgi:hypothetical protein